MKMDIFDIKLSNLLNKEFILVNEIINNDRLRFDELYSSEIVTTVDSLLDEIKDCIFNGKYKKLNDNTFQYVLYPKETLNDIKITCIIKLSDYGNIESLGKYNTYNPLKKNIISYYQLIMIHPITSL